MDQKGKKMFCAVCGSGAVKIVGMATPPVNTYTLLCSVCGKQWDEDYRPGYKLVKDSPNDTHWRWEPEDYCGSGPKINDTPGLLSFCEAFMAIQDKPEMIMRPASPSSIFSGQEQFYVRGGKLCLVGRDKGEKGLYPQSQASVNFLLEVRWIIGERSYTGLEALAALIEGKKIKRSQDVHWLDESAVIAIKHFKATDWLIREVK